MYILIKKLKKWISAIAIGKKRNYLGSYPCEKQAAFVYDQKAKEIYGEFAVLNGINENDIPNDFVVYKNPRESLTSKYKGVSFNKKRQKWSTEIMANKKKYFLGYFSSEKDAALAYNKKSEEINGKFAILNDVREDIIDDQLYFDF